MIDSHDRELAGLDSIFRPCRSRKCTVAFWRKRDKGSRRSSSRELSWRATRTSPRQSPSRRSRESNPIRVRIRPWAHSRLPRVTSPRAPPRKATRPGTTENHADRRDRTHRASRFASGRARDFRKGLAGSRSDRWFLAAARAGATMEGGGRASTGVERCCRSRDVLPLLSPLTIRGDARRSHRPTLRARGQ
jgi:hypothetical protein